MAVRTEEMLLNVGPQHPSTHGVFRIVIKIDGEIIQEARPVIGYLHRGTRNWRKICPTRRLFRTRTGWTTCRA